MGVAPQRGPRGSLGPLCGRGPEHPPTGPGRPGRSRRNLHRDQNRGPRRERPAEGKEGGRGAGSGAHGLTRGAPGSFAPRPGFRSLRISARTATWAAACEAKEGAASLTPGFTWGGASGSVTSALVKKQRERSCPAAPPPRPTHEDDVAPPGPAPFPGPPGGGGWWRGAEFCLGGSWAPPGASVGSGDQTPGVRSPALLAVGGPTHRPPDHAPCTGPRPGLFRGRRPEFNAGEPEGSWASGSGVGGPPPRPVSFERRPWPQRTNIICESGRALRGRWEWGRGRCAEEAWGPNDAGGVSEHLMEAAAILGG